MRVLFVANPEKAHLLAMVPLAWALRTAGHEVRVASQPAFAETITQAGLTAVPVGRDADLWQLLARDHRIPDWTWEPAYGLPTPYDVVDAPDRGTWPHLADGYAEILHSWHRPGSLPMIAGLVEFARSWRPDLVIWEPLAYAGPIAAKACGAAHARLPWSLDVFGVARERFLRLMERQPPGDRHDALADWLGSYARKYDFAFSEDMTTGHFTIDQLPASLGVRADLPYVPMRFVPYGGPATVPKWLWTPPARPRVALTMGLSLTDHKAGYAVSVQDVLDALAGLDVELVATVPESERHRLNRIPDNARLVPYAPLHALAPTCSAIISHAGFGTFLTTALHGVPQLALPWDFDGPAFARMAEAQGATLVIRADQATGPAIRESVLRLLDEPAPRDRARDLRDEMHAMPTPNQLVPHLEELTAKHRTTSR
ncbi:activator-dependent family glycosyltransferase [Streptosporangium sp. NPDC002544]|uniref:activator-dependent family glycosyltransferase n=1 Tax=Streptosporangium sp. NPDC002544 TaxID=3154538 RepID=UPI00332BEAAA